MYLAAARPAAALRQGRAAGTLWGEGLSPAPEDVIEGRLFPAIASKSNRDYDLFKPTSLNNFRRARHA